MGATLNSRMTRAPSEYTLTAEYKAFVESLRKYLREEPSTRTMTISGEMGYLYRGDLTGYLLNEGVPLEDHYLIFRVNDISDPTEFDETTSHLLVPDQNLLGSLKQAYRTKL